MYSFLISSIIATVFAARSHYDNMGYTGSEFLGMTWALVGIDALVASLVHLEWKFELFTPRGQRITTYSKPPHMSWWTVKKNARMEARPLHKEAGTLRGSVAETTEDTMN